MVDIGATEIHHKSAPGLGLVFYRCSQPVLPVTINVTVVFQKRRCQRFQPHGGRGTDILPSQLRRKRLIFLIELDSWHFLTITLSPCPKTKASNNLVANSISRLAKPKTDWQNSNLKLFVKKGAHVDIFEALWGTRTRPPGTSKHDVKRSSAWALASRTRPDCRVTYDLDEVCWVWSFNFQISQKKTSTYFGRKTFGDAPPTLFLGACQLIHMPTQCNLYMASGVAGHQRGSWQLKRITGRGKASGSRWILNH